MLAVSSGTITVNEGSSVQILAEEAFPLSAFDLAVCWNECLNLVLNIYIYIYIYIMLENGIAND